MTETQLAAGASAVLAPRGIVQVNGQNLLASDGWEHWEVTQAVYSEAGQFSIDFALDALPSGLDASWWGSQSTDIFVSILAGFPQNPAAPVPAELTNLIYGRVDSIDVDPVRGALTVAGRDLAAAFIDNKLVQQYQAQTASSVVEQLAAARGIPATVTAVPPSETVGAITQREPVQMSVHQSEWDLITTLARLEGFVAFMTPQGLYWGPDPAQAAGVTPYQITWQPGQNGAPPVSNVTSLKLSRNMTIAKGISVRVYSFSQKTGKPFTANYPTSARDITPGRASPFGAAQTYTFVLRGFHTPEQAQQYAQNRYEQIIAHEMRLSASMPADDILTPQTPIALSGTGTDWDQTYYPQRITRSMSVDEGYAMQVEAKNSSVQT